MGRRLFILAAALVLVAGVVGRLSYENVEASRPAYAQSETTDSTESYDCSDFDTQPEAQSIYDTDPTTYANLDDGTDPSDLSASDGVACDALPATSTDDDSDDSDPTQQQYTSDDDDTMLESGGPTNGPIVTLPDGTCIPEYPVKRNGYCYR